MTGPKRRPFNVDEYYRLLDVGILREDTSVELIEGDMIEQVYPTRLQSSCTMRLHTLFAALKLYDTAIISVKHPVRLSEYTEPIPELTLLRRQDDFYESGHPTPADVLLLGCTHYPLLKPLLQRVVPSGVTLVDSAESTALAAKEVLSANANDRSENKTAQIEFFVTDSIDKFKRLGTRFLGRQIENIKHVDLKE